MRLKTRKYLRKTKKLTKLKKKQFNKHFTSKKHPSKMYKRCHGGQNVSSMTSGIIQGEKIGQGTHGTIYTSTINPTHVIKVFQNVQTVCARAKSYEYDFQNIIHQQMSVSGCKIKIPAVYDFQVNQDTCSYEMERIYPLPEEDNKIIIVDMFSDNIDKIFTHSKFGKTKSYSFIDYSHSNIQNANELAFEIGKLFSYLHFVLHLDGYDCELILGKDIQDIKHFYLIDFDKVSAFNWENYPFTIQRKLDESTYQEIKINSPKKHASILLTAMSSMSLLPIQDKLVSHFIDGYKIFVSGSQQRQVFSEFELLYKEYVLSMVY